MYIYKCVCHANTTPYSVNVYAEIKFATGLQNLNDPVFISLLLLQLLNSQADWVLYACLGNHSRRRKTLNSNHLCSA